MTTSINKVAPIFELNGYNKESINKVKLDQFKNKFKILFFYPLDFTFICPTEMQELVEKSKEIADKDCIILAINTDSIYSHEVWANQKKEDGGLGGLKDIDNLYLLSDYNKKVCEAYGTLIRGGENDGVSNRAVFILDKQNNVRYVSVNDINIGRNIDELIRQLDSLNELGNSKDNIGIPCNWRKSQKTINKTKEGIKDFFKVIE
jgi:alkyl hydroperoxide reductase subunit AhpC